MFEFMHSTGDDTEEDASSTSFCTRNSCSFVSDQENTTKATADSILFQSGWLKLSKFKRISKYIWLTINLILIN